MLIDQKLDEEFTPQDLWGLIIAINDLYDRHPEKFGSANTRAHLKHDINAYIDQWASDPDGTRSSPWTALIDEEFYQFLADRLKAYHLAPFADTSLAIIGGYSGDYYGLSPAAPLLSQFKEIHDIAPHLGKILTPQTAAELAPEKVDYAITGNMVNDPDNNAPEDSFIACAHLLKKGGIAIHMLGWGGDANTRYDSPSLCAKAGQIHLYNIPEGAYNHLALTGTKAMVLEQTHELNLTKTTLASHCSSEGRLSGAPTIAPAPTNPR